MVLYKDKKAGLKVITNDQEYFYITTLNNDILITETGDNIGELIEDYYYFLKPLSEKARNEAIKRFNKSKLYKSIKEYLSQFE